MNVEKTYTVRDLQEDYQTGRIRDFSDLERAIERLLRMKLAYNKGRPYRHGGKAL